MMDVQLLFWYTRRHEEQEFDQVKQLRMVQEDGMHALSAFIRFHFIRLVQPRMKNSQDRVIKADVSDLCSHRNFTQNFVISWVEADSNVLFCLK